jgi:DNA-binding PadR family transcriptional regulator
MASSQEPQDWPILTYIEFFILDALLNAPLHGLGIIAEVTHRTANQMLLIPGSLYPALKRMFDRNWIEEEIFSNHGIRSKQA